MKTISRTVTTCVAACLMVAGSTLFAGTAQATTAQCENYLQLMGYTVTSEMSSACWKGSLGYVRLCQNDLVAHNVIDGHAAEGCRRASWH
jgi:hypothetical protein